MDIFPGQRMPPFMDVLAMALSIILLSVAYAMYHLRKKYDKKYVPFAPGGMKKHLKMRASSEFPWWLLDISKHLHTQVFQLHLSIHPMKQFVVIGDHSVMRAILTDPLTCKPGSSYKMVRDITGGETMLTTNGQVWHAKRKAAAPAFSSNHVKRMTSVALENTETWIQQKLVVLCDNNESFDVGEEMISIIVVALAETAFEYKMSKQEANLFRENLDLALTEFIRKATRNPLRRIFGSVLPERQAAIRSLEYVHGLVRTIVAEYRKKEKHLTTSGTIIELVMESDSFPNDDDRVAQLVEFLLVGHDTTAYSISWILLCLAKHPDEQVKLRASLDKLSPENWRNSEVLKTIIKEGMRLYPVARSVRMTGRDIMTSCGLIPKGSVCSLQFLLAFRDPNIFDQPDTFIPSRWRDNPTNKMKDAFNPFSLGSQNCVGQSLAQAETHAVVARLCSEFELSVECEGTSDYSVTLKPVGVRLKACKV